MIALLVLGGNPDHAKTTSASGVPLSPISVAAPPPNAAADTPCTALLGSLPTAIPISGSSIAGRPAQSSWTYVAAWGDPAIVLRCGVPRPAGLTVNSGRFIIVIDGVSFFEGKSGNNSVFTAVDRTAYVEVSVPKSYAQPPLGPLADAIAKALPAVCLPQAGPGQTPVPAAKLCTHRK